MELMEMALDLQVFCLKSKYWTNSNFEQMVAVAGKSEVITGHPDLNTNVCTIKFCGKSIQ